MRMSDVPGGFLVELHPLGLVPKQRVNKGAPGHWIWWDMPDGGREAIEASPVLRCIRRVKRPFSLILDEDGLPVSQATTSE